MRSVLVSMSSILTAGGRYVCAVVDTVQVTPNCVLLWSASSVGWMPTTAFDLNIATVVAGHLRSIFASSLGGHTAARSSSGRINGVPRYAGECHGYSLPSWRARRFGLAKFSKRRRLSPSRVTMAPKELAWETKAAKKTRQKASSSESTNRKKNNRRNRIRTSRELREDGLNE